MSRNGKRKDWGDFGFSTRSIHAGQDPDLLTGSVTVPIYQTSTFAQESAGKTKGFEYSRTGNPTRDALEKSIATIERARFGLAFSSGMSAIDTIGNTLRAGSKVLICDDVYGGTFRLFSEVFSRFSVTSEFVDASNLDKFQSKLKQDSFALVLVESPTNPLMKVIDISGICDFSHKNGARVVVDNTFPSPYLCNPLTLGADIVVHSTTKYIGGHSDLIGGAIATNQEAEYQQLKFLQNACGGVPGPFDCWLVLRGIKTLSLRMEKHCDNAEAVSSFLHSQVGKGRVKSVNYPGLMDNPFHELAKSQMKRFGAMLSFELQSEDQAVTLLRNLRLFTTAESLGGVESLAEIPAIMTHASIPQSERLARGITNSLVRLSVGIEDKEDLIEDLSGALS